MDQLLLRYVVTLLLASPGHRQVMSRETEIDAEWLAIQWSKQEPQAVVTVEDTARLAGSVGRCLYAYGNGLPLIAPGYRHNRVDKRRRSAESDE